MTQITDRRINQIINHLDIATRTKPHFDHDTTHQLAWLDNNQTNETGITAQGTINDPVAAQVIARSHIIDRMNQVDQLIARIESDTRTLVTKLNTGKHRTPAAQDEPLCDGGDPSTWGDVTCGDIVRSEQRGSHIWYHPAGLCPKHLKRKERHERHTTT